VHRLARVERDVPRHPIPVVDKVRVAIDATNHLVLLASNSTRAQCLVHNHIHGVCLRVACQACFDLVECSLPPLYNLRVIVRDVVQQAFGVEVGAREELQGAVVRANRNQRDPRRHARSVEQKRKHGHVCVPCRLVVGDVPEYIGGKGLVRADW
jgi:hypothetical protein